MLAWHWVGDTLRDGRKIPEDGRELVHKGPLVMCETGLHASTRILDALRYAPGHTICRVQLGGEIVHGDDKLVAARRTILWRLNAEEILWKCARLSALDVVHLWDAPDVVRRFLKTGDESLRAAARTAAGAAAGARTAAWAAAWAAALAAAGAGAAARAAAGAGDAAWAAARAAARTAALAAAGDGDAAWAAARAAARAAAWDKKNRRLTRMVLEEHRRHA